MPTSRVVRRLDEIDRDQDRPGRGRRLGRERGLRRPRPRRRRVGLREQPPPDDGGGRPRRRRGRPHRPGQRHRAARPGRARRPAAGPRDATRPRSRRTRSTIPLERKIADLLAADAGRQPASRASPSPSRCTPPSASGRRSRRPTAASPSRPSPTSARPSRPTPIDGDEHQRRSYPDSGGGWQAAGYEYIRGLDLAGRAEPLADEAVALLTAPQCPSRPVHDRPRPVASSTCRSTRAAATRPSSTGSSAPRRATRGRAS